MTRDGFLIEDRPEGRTVVVTGSWTAAARAALDRPDVDGVWLNYAKGFSEPDLTFVGEWPIRRLLVLDRKITDLSPLNRLGRTLEELTFEVAPGTTVDLGQLPRLKSLAAGWGEVEDTFHEPEGLREVTLVDYDEVDLHPLSVQPSLETVLLTGAPRLERLDGVDHFALRRLAVALARELEDIDALTLASASLRDVRFESCLGLYDIECVAELTRLRFLGVSDCGGVPSIHPVANRRTRVPVRLGQHESGGRRPVTSPPAAAAEGGPDARSSGVPTPSARDPAPVRKPLRRRADVGRRRPP